MFTLPNLISFCRVPLALLFLQENLFWRVFAICCALLSDGLDGYIARKTQSVSKVGTLLDPLMDKFFVFFSLVILLREHPLQVWQVMAMFCRDFSILFFGAYLAWKGTLAQYRFRAIWCGKVTTVLQMMVLLGLTVGVEIPSAVFVSFIVLGMLALGELALFERRTRYG